MKTPMKGGERVIAPSASGSFLRKHVAVDHCVCELALPAPRATKKVRDLRSTIGSTGRLSVYHKHEPSEAVITYAGHVSSLLQTKHYFDIPACVFLKQLGRLFFMFFVDATQTSNSFEESQ